MIRRALLSVSDKTGIVGLAQSLTENGVEIIATGGTAQLLKEQHLPVTDVAQLTGYPEMLDGRVKTLHPVIHAALLADRNNPEHINQIRKHQIQPIDLVVINLYSFEKVTRSPDVTLSEAIENIDIGGPALIRSAAKNYTHVCIVTDPADYPIVADYTARKLPVPLEIRQQLMIKAFDHTARYDRLISDYFRRITQSPDDTPATITLTFKKSQSLRYGENPHQRASFYMTTTEAKAVFRQLHGKDLSYNNILDMDACARMVAEFDQAVCVIVKHNNPCGVAIAGHPKEAFLKARSTDPQAAYGGIIGFNRTVDESTADALSEMFVEVLMAPAFTEPALATLQKKKNIRLIEFSPEIFQPAPACLTDIRSAMHGYLLQTPDYPVAQESDFVVASRRSPSESEWQALRLGWKVVRHVKSNAVVICNTEQTLGIGAGQMSRVDAVKIAIAKARESGFDLKGTALASDAFFPFRDNIDLAAEAGISAVIQPGGSIHDEQIREAINEHHMTMIITNERHFRH